MMKILIIANNDIGLYRFRKQFIADLLGKGYDVILACPKGECTLYFLSQGASFIPISMNRRGTNPLADLNLFWQYVRLLWKEKPHVVLTYTIKPNIYGSIAASLFRIPVLATITGLGTALEYESRMQKFLVFLYRIAFRKVKAVFFQNRENYQFFCSKRIPCNKACFVPGSGVSLDENPLLPFPEGKETHFLFIARIMKEKGIDEYLAAAEYFSAKKSNTVFHILGAIEDSRYENILADLNKKGVIRYHGQVDNVKDFFEMAQCTIHPTFYPEGMSNVLLESCACGRPIITTNRSGCREIVEDGVNGFVVNAKDSKDLIAKIEQFLSLPWDLRKAMGLAARRKVEAEFDRALVVQAYMKEIEEIMEKDHGL